MTNQFPLDVTLAGFNVDRDTLHELETAAYENGAPPARESITPETISAAYARISRNPSEIGKIRCVARHEVEKARRSNDTIVFGLGHSSVAEHATFNLDVVGISRLAVEAVERHRLASFTEKSQRYIKLDGDIVIPPEIEGAGLKQQFLELIDAQNAAYFELHPLLTDYFAEILEVEGVEKPRNLAKSRAAEDARYVVSLATQAQFGMTINARTLETMVRDGFAHPLAEVNAFADQLCRTVRGLTPSLVKYTNATAYEKAQFERASYWAESSSSAPTETIRLVHYDRESETRIFAAFFLNQEGIDWTTAYKKADSLTQEDREAILRCLLREAQQWDPPPREFELASATFELVLSAAAFGQLKRHRMATQITGPYDPTLGWTCPDSIENVGKRERFDEIMEQSADVARIIAKSSPAAAPYALCNGHRRRVIFRADARELYHISRLREDEHAQWDIRTIATRMLQLVRSETPVLFSMAVGKHEFSAQQKKVYGNA